MKIERISNQNLADALDATLRTRKELAASLGIAPQTLSALVHGRLPIGDRMRQKLSELLGISEEALFGRKEDV